MTSPPQDSPKIAKGIASKLGWLLLGAILFTPLATVVGIYVDNRGWFDFLERPTIPEQLEEIRHTAAGDGRRFAVFERLRLHDAVLSYVVVLADTDSSWPDMRSDEVRIYDTTPKDDLELRFRFLPENHFADNDFPGIPHRFRFDEGRDVDRDGIEEVLGSYSLPFADVELAIPVLIGWDPALDRYQMAPALTSAPNLALDGKRGSFGASAQRLYREETRLSDSRREVTLTALAADEYVWTRGELSGGPVLLAAYTVKGECRACPHTFQVIPWAVRIAWPSLEVTRCDRFDGLPATFLNPTFEGGSLQQQVLEAWREASDRC